MLQSEASTDAAVIETPLGTVELKDAAQTVTEVPAEAPKAEEVVQTVNAGANTPVALETPAVADTTIQSETQQVHVEAAPETVTQDEVFNVETETVAAEAPLQSTDAPKEAEITVSETPAVVETIKTDVEAAAAQIQAPEPSPDPANEPVNSAAEGPQTVASSEEETHCASSEIKSEAPSSGETSAVTAAEVSLGLKRQESEPVTVSDPNSLNVSVGSESIPSVESFEEVKTTQSSEDEVSATSDNLDDEANVTKSPVSSDDAAQEKTTSDEPSPQTQEDAVSGDVGVDIEAGASVEPSVEAADATTPQPSEPAAEETSSSPEAPPADSIKEIRDLVMEVIEVEELVQRYPSGIPKVEE